MINAGFCNLCGWRFDADPDREHNDLHHTDCAEKIWRNRYYPGDEVYVRSLNRTGNVVVALDVLKIPIQYLVEFSYPQAQETFPDYDLRHAEKACRFCCYWKPNSHEKCEDCFEKCNFKLR